MTRRNFLNRSLTTSLAPSLATGGQQRGRTARPNILFIMSDDHAAPAISAYNSRLIATPNIDRLASQGMRFDAAMVTNSICTPSRAVLVSGQHSHVTGVLGLADRLEGSRQLLPRLLRDAGYYTGVVGKWHLHAEPAGFDFYAVLPGQGRYYDPFFLHTGEYEKRVRHQGYVTDLIGNFALEFLGKRPKDRPFFLMYHHKAPHDNFIPKNEHRGLFSSPIPEPPTLFEDVSGRTALMETTEKVGRKHLGYGDPQWRRFLERVQYTSAEIEGWEKRLSGLTGRELKHAQYRIFMRRYLQCVHSVDENVGRVLDFLDREGLADNTIVFYTSDQGYFLGEHGLYDKRLMYEPSLRIPLLVRWPGHTPAGSTSKALVQNLDFAPTMLDAAGVKPPSSMQGQSFREILLGNKPGAWRDAIYYRYWMNRAHFNVPAHLGVRTARYKLIYFYDSDRGPDGKTQVRGSQRPLGAPFWEFYDLETDPYEMHNAFQDPGYRKVISGLVERLVQLREQYGDNKDGIDLRQALNITRAHGWA